MGSDAARKSLELALSARIVPALTLDRVLIHSAQVMLVRRHRQQNQSSGTLIAF